SKSGFKGNQNNYIYMFGSNPKITSATPASEGTHQSAYGSAPNRISSGVSITGDVKISSELVLDGVVEGNITSSGKLSIGSNATVDGDVRVGSVTRKALVGARMAMYVSTARGSRRSTLY